MNKLIQVEKVISVYSGRKGCACGCRGKYSYASRHAQLGGKIRGYEVKPEDISDRSVAIITNKLNKELDMVEVSVFEKVAVYSLEKNNRLYIVTIKKEDVSGNKTC